MCNNQVYRLGQRGKKKCVNLCMGKRKKSQIGVWAVFKVCYSWVPDEFSLLNFDYIYLSIQNIRRGVSYSASFFVMTFPVMSL